MPGWARARLNPGFHLIGDREDVRSEPGKEYDFLILVQGNRLRYYLDGEKIHDIAVDEPLEGGWFGLRTWFSSVDFEEVKVGVPLEQRDARHDPRSRGETAPGWMAHESGASPARFL